MTESQIQAECFQWFHNNYTINNKGVCFAVPNGGTRNKREAMLLKATGVVSGVSDLIVLLPKKALFFEVKTDDGKQSEKQRWFQKLVELLGFEYYLVRNIEDFKKIVFYICTINNQ